MGGVDVTLSVVTTDSQQPIDVEGLRRINRVSVHRLINPPLTDGESFIGKSLPEKPASVWAAQLNVKEVPFKEDCVGMSLVRQTVDLRNKATDLPTESRTSDLQAPVVSKANSNDTRSAAPASRCYDMQNAMLFSCVDRPTTASSIRSKRWSRERSLYDEEHLENMEQFKHRPYMRHAYPELPKHYPGTWRVARSAELGTIVARLTKPTLASRIRAQDIRLQQTYLQRFRQLDKEKDIMFKKEQQDSKPGNRVTSCRF
ncbi:uncharacterized protein LOC121384707 [Gigantopelta aegis]|uniref:uncharacterized protein LOC121384707 n=1 Tax=Gigantopelta aegis TaxID=1735272 RepID=UPI001B88B697|nr:uncharacterized protein LOC121384707 [Gigantopelta aegis]